MKEALRDGEEHLQVRAGEGEQQAKVAQCRGKVVGLSKKRCLASSR